MNVLVMNADYSFLGSISWQRSIVLLYQGKAEMVKETERVISNYDGSYTFVIPRIIRLLNYVTKVFKNKIPYSKFNVFLRDDFTCQYCGKKLLKQECTVDHVVPKVMGGASSWDNCVTSCKPCNNKKGDKTVKEMGYKLLNTPRKPSVADFMRKKASVYIDDLESLFS
jgi:5-methylcytosine-specific restriction endonuclease McrA